MDETVPTTVHLYYKVISKNEFQNTYVWLLWRLNRVGFGIDDLKVWVHIVVVSVYHSVGLFGISCTQDRHFYL